VLPQYTFIMLAGKAVPKQCVDYLSGKVKTRRSIGVRMPADPICQVPGQ
jgi:tRNA A37 threonylcarbamoyladenosine synthetase subunit TsaC/SUA5/YrdC